MRTSKTISISIENEEIYNKARKIAKENSQKISLLFSNYLKRYIKENQGENGANRE